MLSIGLMDNTLLYLEQKEHWQLVMCPDWWLQIFRKEPFFYGHDNHDQLVKIAKVSISLNLHITCLWDKDYSLRFGKRSRLKQRHSLQNTTLTSLFYKNIYWKVKYVYFYEKNFQNKSIDMIFTFLNSIT
jgi:hypothetical protein